MRGNPQPVYNFYLRLDPETQALRQELEDETGLKPRELFKASLRALERQIYPRRATSSETAAT
jgi:hypothetical protein